MIRAYLGEEPVLKNAQTWSLAVEDERRYVMDHFDELVIKSRSGWGGKDVLIAPRRQTKPLKSSASRSSRTPSSTWPKDPSTSRPTSCARPRTMSSFCATP